MCVSNIIESLVERTRGCGEPVHEERRELREAGLGAPSGEAPPPRPPPERHPHRRRQVLIAYGLKRDQNVFSFAVMHHLNMTKGNWVLQCPKEARLPSHERGMLGRCGAPVFPSVGTTSSNASHHGCGHFGLPYY